MGNLSVNHQSTPRVFLYPTLAVYLGPCLDLEPHENALATFIICLEREFSLKTSFRLNDEFAQHRIALMTR
jgi:hypothetical protein